MAGLLSAADEEELRKKQEGGLLSRFLPDPRGVSALYQAVQTPEGRAKIGSFFYDRFVDPAVQAVTLPGRVMRGEISPYAATPDGQVVINPQMVDEAMNMALNLTGGSALAPAEAGALRMGASAIKKKAASKELGYDPAKVALDYPDKAPPVLAIDKKTGKEYLAKDLSPEALAVDKARKQAQKEINAGDYTPMFPLEERYYVDPANYPLEGNTLVDAMPKKQATIDKYKGLYDTPEARARLQGGYDKAKDDPLAAHWYAMGQLEKAYTDELGIEAGRAAFKKDFADAMAATTGGADPTSNLLMAHYGNFEHARGNAVPKNAYDMPYPIGGRYASGNMGQYEKFIAGGNPLTAADNPKRFDFSANFQGHRSRATIDEQMSNGFQPGLNIPPGDSYGIFEGVVHDLARANGVMPANFQDVAWAGLKGVQGKPMMQHVNEMLARTSKVTGLPQDEVLRGYIRKTMPMYQGGPGGAMAYGLLGPQQEEYP